MKPGAVPRSHPWTPECPRFGTRSWHPSAQESGASVQRWGCGTALRPPGERPLGRTEAQTTATLARWPRDRFLTNTSTFGSTEPGREQQRGPSGPAAPRAGNVSSGMGQGVHGEINVTQQEGKLRQGGRRGGKGRRVARGAPLPRRGGQTPGPGTAQGAANSPAPHKSSSQSRGDGGGGTLRGLSVVFVRGLGSSVFRPPLTGWRGARSRLRADAALGL